MVLLGDSKWSFLYDTVYHIFFNVIYFEKERACVGDLQRKREKENPKQAPHCLCAEPNAGLNPMNCEIVTWGEMRARRLTN